MTPLTVACIAARVDYNRARLAIMRGEVRGELREHRLWCDPKSLQAWQASRAGADQIAPMPAA